jgi:phosphopantothenoylcysteine decarboxylase/phosphopantothenate--cysteine ligase
MFNEDTWSNHVMLGRWADLFLITPTSCNTLAKMANGLCDNFLMATYMSATCPIMMAPAMDEDMWHHTATQSNLNTLASFPNHIILDAEHGELASGLIGMGRMAEPEKIMEQVDFFFQQQNSLHKKTILITAGPTYENIDPVRFIGNYSSGKMGIALALNCAEKGANVQLVLGPTTLEVKHKNIVVHRVTNAKSMFEACESIFPKVDIAIMSAAVADYTPIMVASEKIKKKTESFTIELQKTKDILAFCGANKKEHQIVVGFALESNDEKNYAKGKLASKNADLIILNSVNDKGAGFGYDTNKITIFTKNGAEIPFELKSKNQVAQDIIQQIMFYANY